MSDKASELDETHDPQRKSWVASANGHSDFPAQNLPFGIFAPPGAPPRAGVAIGDFIVDLRALAAAELLPKERAAVLATPTLNALFALPSEERVTLRRRLSQLVSEESQRAAVEPHLHAASSCTLHLPATIGDFTDFYVGIHHATNVGKQFRPDQPLMPNYKWLPVGYHGRASSVRVSGASVTRPNGQRKPPHEESPVFGPSRRLDYELEMGIWIGEGNALGIPIPIADAERHVAGLCLLNDWSARDIQAWEYQPLGPFLAKSFHTSISPWVITSEALAPFRIAQPARPAGDPQPLAHLYSARDQAAGALAIELRVGLRTSKMRAANAAPFVVSRSAARHMYWTIQQIVTHHASNGCDLHPGDLLGTGTLSADSPDGLGSLLESTKAGSEPLQLPGGETRAFLEDGDEVTFTATATNTGFVPIGFGECRAVILPAQARSET